jgi:hypothetical protein
MTTDTHFGYVQRLIKLPILALRGLNGFIESKMPLLKRSRTIASYRSKLAHGQTYKVNKDVADVILARLKDTKKRRAAKQHATADARLKA